MWPKFRQEADMSFIDPCRILGPAVSQIVPAAADLNSEPV